METVKWQAAFKVKMALDDSFNTYITWGRSEYLFQEMLSVVAEAATRVMFSGSG